MIRRITHAGERGNKSIGTIFDGVGEIHATLYQSLCGAIGQDYIPESSWDTQKWNSTEQCRDLLPLAWAESNLSEESDSGVRDARVLVAVQHRTKPFWALQYHPESICTNEESKEVITNWFRHAQLFNHTSRQTRIKTDGYLHGEFATRESLLSRFETFRPMLNGSASFPTGSHFSTQADEIENGQDSTFYSRTVDLPIDLSVADIVECLQSRSQDQIILESSNAYETAVGTADVRGRYSIIALDMENCVRFEYTTGSNQISAIYPNQPSRLTDLRQFGGIWPFLAQYLNKRKVVDGEVDSPFWGGFMGYTTYELGLEGIDVPSQGRNGPQKTRPDLCFAWITRSLVIDHVKGLVYMQQLAPKGAILSVDDWMTKIEMKLETANRASSNVNKEAPSKASVVTRPKDSEYESKVSRCQESIRNGDSYELCLTDQTTVTRPRDSSWSLY
ncbi:Aminodeoxychorismate synthase, partial [Lachnellula suecica]